MNLPKKSVGPLVATGLFIVVAVVATISFQVWMQEYSSNLFSQINENTEIFDIRIERVDDGILYLSNSYTNDIYSDRGLLDTIRDTSLIPSEELYLSIGGHDHRNNNYHKHIDFVFARKAVPEEPTTKISN